MEIAPLPSNESARLDALRRYEILDTESEQAFDDLVELAAKICETPIALVSLVDPLRQWFKAKTGVTACETSRDIAFCAHAILQRGIFEVPDTLTDPRFATNPLVTADPFIRFYAGTPLVTPDGYALGTLCVIDRVPRQLNTDQREALTTLGRQVVSLLELRLRQTLLERSMAAQQQAQLVQAQLSFALDHGIDGAALLDREGRYTYMNPAHAKIYGYEATELIGQSWTVLYSSEWAARINEEFFPILLQQGHWRGELTSRKQSGEAVLAEVSLTLLSQQDISGNWLFCTCRDITAEKNRTAEFVDTLTAIERVLATIEFALDGTVLTANRNFLQLMGYRLEEIQGQHHRLFCDSDYVASPEYESFWDKLNRGEFDAGVYRLLGKNGQTVWLQSSYNPIFDANGTPYKIVKFATDITKQKQAEAVRLEQEMRLRLAADAAEIGVWEWDIRSGAIRWDAKMFALYGLPPTPDGRGQYEDWRKRVFPEDIAAQEAQLQRCTITGERGELEFRIVRASDQAQRVIHSAEYVIMGDDGRPSRMVGVNIDITERKTVEAKLQHVALEMARRNLSLAEANRTALEATRAKSEFLASMSHEIRTPMNAIIGMADLLQYTALTEEQQEYVQRFSRAATSLMDLINDILDLTKIEAGHLELESIPFSLADLVDKTVELLAVRANAKALELVAFVHPDVPSYVMGDPTRLRQVLVNLLGNAIKFTELGEVVIRVDPSRDKADPCAFHFSVSDTGIGVPADKTQAIFDSFTQVDSSTTRKYGGTGLGLSISKQIVELMGGHIEVTSKEGQGSLFSFTLHMAAVPNSTPAPDQPSLDLNGRRMLVVDDNATNRMIIREFLTRMGVILSEASNGPTALAALEEAHRRGEPFQLAILDYHMPGMNGLELAQAIRARPAFVALSLVIHASDMRNDQTRQGRTLGITSYIHKPISRARLLASLAEALNPATTLISAPAPSAPSAPADFRPLHILLAEDLEDNRDVVSLYVKGTPYVLDMAENGEIAVEKFRSNTYDLVFMDIQMPVMDGYQATEAIREWEREQQRTPTPIVAFTANAFKEDIEMSLAVGCIAHLTKPLKKQTLLNAIAEYARRPSDQTH